MRRVRGTRISVGGLGGVGTSLVSKLLAERLGYKSMSAGKYFRDFAIREGVTNAVIEERAVTDKKYDRILDRRTKAYGRANNYFVFEGRLAWRFIKGVRILLVSDFYTRVARIAGREGITFERALRETIRREHLAAARYIGRYNVLDITNPKLYTFVVDTTGITAEEVTEKIVGFLKVIGEYHPLKAA